MNPSELFKAIRAKNVETVKKLLDEGCDPSVFEEGGRNNALCLSVSQPEMVEYLLKKGARVNDRTKSGRTALHQAVWQYDNDKRSVEFLLEAGADIHAVDNENWTPIWLSDRFHLD